MWTMTFRRFVMVPLSFHVAIRYKASLIAQHANIEYTKP